LTYKVQFDVLGSNQLSQQYSPVLENFIRHYINSNKDACLAIGLDGIRPFLNDVSEFLSVRYYGDINILNNGLKCTPVDDREIRVKLQRGSRYAHPLKRIH